jgi:hypothetical protein
MPMGSESDAVLQKIEVIPSVRRMHFNASQQLSVIGHYSDGTKRDVTRLASYEANQPEMASVRDSGLVSVTKTPGETAVMVRFQGEVAVFRGEVPQGLPVTNTPPEKSFVDNLAFNRLKVLGIPPSPLCDDATFIRRATLDITGRLPTEEEVSVFLQDANPAKRDTLVDRLVDSPGYAEYFANKWSAVLRNKRRNNNDIPYTYRFHAWIRDSLDANLPYDEFVRLIHQRPGIVKLEHRRSSWKMSGNSFWEHDSHVRNATTIPLSVGVSKITISLKRSFRRWVLRQVGLIRNLICPTWSSLREIFQKHRIHVLRKR